MPSENVENYLKRIYSIELTGERVSTSLLSEKLQISPASVTEMIKRLADDGNVVYTPYKGVELTQKGKKNAIRVLRRHRLWELFLVKVLHYGWDEIHEEAERLQHMTSAKLEERLDAFLGHPALDPHGDAIPTADGVLTHGGAIPLTQSTASTLVVTRVSDENPDILKYATRCGITLGRTMKVKERMAFDGSMKVEIDGRELFISAMFGDNIFVRPSRPKKDKRYD